MFLATGAGSSSGVSCSKQGWTRETRVAPTGRCMSTNRGWQQGHLSPRGHHTESVAPPRTHKGSWRVHGPVAHCHPLWLPSPRSPPGPRHPGEPPPQSPRGCVLYRAHEHPGFSGNALTQSTSVRVDNWKRRRTPRNATVTLRRRCGALTDFLSSQLYL